MGQLDMKPMLDEFKRRNGRDPLFFEVHALRKLTLSIPNAVKIEDYTEYWEKFHGEK